MFTYQIKNQSFFLLFVPVAVVVVFFFSFILLFPLKEEVNWTIGKQTSIVRSRTDNQIARYSFQMASPLHFVAYSLALPCTVYQKEGERVK